MAGTVVAVFDDNHQAERAAQTLVDDGVPLADITLVFHGAAGRRGRPTITTRPTTRTALATGVREVETHDVERPINAVDEMAPRAIVGLVIGAPAGVAGRVPAGLLPELEYHHRRPRPGLGADQRPDRRHPRRDCRGHVSSGGVPKEAAKGYHAEIEKGKTLVTVLASSGNAPHFQEMLRTQGGRRLGFFPRFLDTIQSVES